MLETLYKNSSEKDLKKALLIYNALLICTFILSFSYLAYDYFANGNIRFSASLIIFIIIFFWSFVNVKYLKGKIDHKNK